MGYQFKVGDKVTVRTDHSLFWKDCGDGERLKNGGFLEITKTGAKGNFVWKYHNKDGLHESSCSGHQLENDDFILYGNNNNNMSLKKSFTNIFLKEPEKSFRKADITGEDGVLTADGQAVFLTWVLQKNGDAFKSEVVDPILAEQNEE